MRFDIITSFPDIFNSYFGMSILKRAQEQKLVDIRMWNLRNFAKDKRRTVDDKPYGGGAGMVLMAGPIMKAAGSVLTSRRKKSEYISDRKYTRDHRGKTKIVVLSAKGKQFNQKMAYDWTKRYNRLVFISGRYEGIDERVKQILKAAEISIGPYVLTDGDVAAMVIISSVARLIPGVIKLESLQEESHWNLLMKREATSPKRGVEYPHYTRPEILRWRGRTYRVPKVLLRGDHRAIAVWRQRHRL